MTKYRSAVAGSMLLVVAAALVGGEGRALLRQRPPGKVTAGLWELPGGTVEVAETPDAALAHELREQPGIVAVLGAMRPWSAPLDDRRLLPLL